MAARAPSSHVRRSEVHAEASKTRSDKHVGSRRGPANMSGRGAGLPVRRTNAQLGRDLAPCQKAHVGPPESPAPASWSGLLTSSVQTVNPASVLGPNVLL